MPRTDDTITGLETPQDKRETAEVMMRAFSQGPQMERLLMTSRWTGDTGRPEYTRVLRVDGRVVCAAVAAPRDIRFGPVTVPAFTVGPVGTHDKYRKRGYAARIMEEVNRFAREQGAVVAYLQGIADFYHRFGYYPFAAYGALMLGRASAENAGTKGRARTMQRKDLDAVAALYTRAAAGRNGASERTADLWSHLFSIRERDNLLPKPHVIQDEAGEVCGYFTCSREDRLNAPECVVRDDAPSCRAALAALARHAKRHEWKDIRLLLPYDDPFCVFTRQHVDAHYDLNSHPTGGLLMTVLDLPNLMRRIAPMFTERVKAMASPPRKTAFTLQAELGSVGMAVDKTGVEIRDKAQGSRVRVPQRWLPGLLTGHWTPDDIAARDGVRMPAKLLPLLRALFPRAWPHVYQGDNY